MVSLNGFYKKNNDKNSLGVEIKKVKISMCIYVSAHESSGETLKIRKLI